MARRRPRRGTLRTRYQDLSPTQKRCTSKRRYPDEAAAAAAIERIKEEVAYIGGVGPRGVLEAYRCSRCHFWHIGHRQPREKGDQT